MLREDGPLMEPPTPELKPMAVAPPVRELGPREERGAVVGLKEEREADVGPDETEREERAEGADVRANGSMEEEGGGARGGLPPKGGKAADEGGGANEGAERAKGSDDGGGGEVGPGKGLLEGGDQAGLDLCEETQGEHGEGMRIQVQQDV